MPEQSQFVGNSVEELLVSLAEGVREAQMALNSGPLVDPSGRPLTSYQLPFLDFTIQVTMETKSGAGGRPVALMFLPKAADSKDQSVRSTISGRLVATPPGEGLPVPRITIDTAGNIGGKAAITLTVSNSAGETLANQPVELNIDDRDSDLLSKARGTNGMTRLPGTRLAAALLTTDAAGKASTVLEIADQQAGKGVVVVVASIGPFSARAAIPVELVG
ncbi:hypothetical protein [Sandaracinobacteroides saxicola]|uniref:Uncharacterized protein n=1 Tax=Sandaracinobacteroides saxicola TaxID=2759707 RepID=A0A7G5IHL3_9SPHN|nr:hypothetical protein [Sandaracinobacteroides saxicola]QMW22855.1 hypothetical protein H3309_16420 [Sandaracinobacteroides saxicola]